jgi:2-aminoadipate transaminase
MTIDETPRGPGSDGESRSMGRSRTTARDLERYAGLFARRTQGMKSSAMRDLMAITARPEVISLAGGLPDTSTFPAEDLAALMARVAADASARALQYGPTEGMERLKACIVEVMAEEGMDVDGDDLLVTTGGQQVIDLVCKTLIDPGDVIVAEGPTYPGAVPTFGAYEADVVQIEMDADGMRVDLLEETLDRLEHEGRTPKFIYTVPTFQNPAGVTLSLERRRRLVRLAAERELLVLEDNPYGLLRYEGDPLPPLYALDRGEYVIYLGTFSKILSPGLRLGWTAAPRPVLEKLNLGKQGADLCSSSFGQHFVIEYFARRDWRKHLDVLRELYRRRRDTMLDALAEHFPPATEWTRPAGGLFVWATLPDYIDTTDMLARALREHVAFVPGRAAYLDGQGASAMRLNFSGVTEEDLREGIARIGKVIDEQVRLYSTLAGTEPTPSRAPASPPDRSPAEPEGARAAERETRREPGVHGAGAGADAGEHGRIVPLRRRAG